jgi:acetyl esterase/lipase
VWLHEGAEVAQWLNARGIAAFVLKYRVIETPADDAAFLETRARNEGRSRIGDRSSVQERMQAHRPLAIADGLQAMRVVRDHAQEWGLREDRVGMLGFSAGGNLSVGVALANKAESRPAFVAPIYGGLRSELVVPEDAPPLFTALASNDPIALEPCLALYQAWHTAGRPAELHIYAQGGHGFGMFKQGLPSDAWIERLAEWLGAQGLV